MHLTAKQSEFTALCCAQARQRGFTLAELVTVIVIIGILAAVAVPRFMDRNAFDSRGFYDQAISTLRYAQKAAIAQHRFVCVTVGANIVTLTYDPVSFNAITHPAATCPGSNLTGPTVPTLPPPSNLPCSPTTYAVCSNNSTFSAGAPAMFSFDALGRPSAAQSFTVNGYNNPITIEMETGYVH